MTDARRASTDAVTGVIAQLRERFGADALDIVEYWDEDCCAVGLVRPDGRARLAYVSTCGRPPGRYDLTLEDSTADGAESCVACGHYRDVELERLVGLVGAHVGLVPGDGPGG